MSKTFSNEKRRNLVVTCDECGAGTRYSVKDTGSGLEDQELEKRVNSKDSQGIAKDIVGRRGYSFNDY